MPPFFEAGNEGRPDIKQCQSLAQNGIVDAATISLSIWRQTFARYLIVGEGVGEPKALP
jgi:hypothetical protein